LREKVSELYGNFCWMEAAPNATQLEAIEDLEKDYKTQALALNKVVVKHLPKNPEIKLNLNAKNE
jgi:hypothetical protein